MIKWYKEPYFDAEAWILENFEKLNLTNDELVFLLLLMHAKKNKIKLNYEYFIKKLRMDNKSIDKLISGLVQKKYLNIVTNEKGISFLIDNLFEFDPSQYEIAANSDIYQTITETFNRTLTSLELEKVSDLINKYGENKFNDALRMAEAYKKYNMSYIEKILINDEKN